MTGGPALACPGCGSRDVDLRRGLLCGTCAEPAAGEGGGDGWLNGRRAADSELAALERGRQHEREQGKALLAGLLSQYPRQPATAQRPVQDLPVLP